MPTDVDVETAPAEFQMEMTDLQRDMDLRSTFRHDRLLDAYTLFLPISFQRLVTKNKKRSRENLERLDDGRLETFIRVATSHIRPNTVNQWFQPGVRVPLGYAKTS
jgi:hypothetical protein